MHQIFRIVYREIWNTLKRPQRILQVFNPRSLNTYFQMVGVKSRVKEDWSSCGNEANLKSRQYSSYEDYTIHQKDKLNRLCKGQLDFQLMDYDTKFRAALGERLKNLDLLSRGMAVLCLAARIGTEVQAFMDVGCYAIGIDLNPGPENRYVLYGDFHDLQFADDSIDVVFTNSLDHVFNVDKVMAEIRRVLKPGGLMILEAESGDEEGGKASFYECFWWSKTDDLVALLEKYRFKLVQRTPIDYPWSGEQLCFNKLLEDEKTV